MRARLKRFLPIVLLALAVQIFAPIAACWAASIAASDPLNAAAICHSDRGGSDAQDDLPGGPQDAQNGCCALCGVVYTAAAIEPPQTAAFSVFDRQATSVVWHEFALDSIGSRAGSPEQARAPPVLS